jgi:hypothetical protein
MACALLGDAAKIMPRYLVDMSRDEIILLRPAEDNKFGS